MHEYSIVASLIDRVRREALAHGADRVHRLHVQIGQLAGVELELLRTAFETFRERTVCAGAELAIELVPAAWTCPSCDRAIDPGAVLRCPACNRPAHLSRGDEIVLARLELEVPDV